MRGGGREHLVAAHHFLTGVIAGQVACGRAKGKGRKPGAARALITDLHAAGLPAGAVITGDAAHTQIATVAATAAGGGHYLLTVKRNQPTLGPSAHRDLASGHAATTHEDPQDTP